MRDQMHVAVQTIQPMNNAPEGSKETPVDALQPVRRQHGVGGCVRGDPMSEVIHLGVADVPPFSHG